MNTNIFKQWVTYLKDHFLETGLLLIFLLPPIGIGLLVITGIVHLIKMIKNKLSLPFTVGSFFFINLLIASIGASFMFLEIKYFMIPVLIASYLGYYLYIKEHFSKKLFTRFINIVINGGIYIAFIGQFQLLFPSFTTINPIIGSITGWMPLSFDESNRLFGSAYNPNFAAFFLLMSVALLLRELLSSLQNKQQGQKKRTGILRIIGLILILGFAIIQTGSRSGVIGMILLMIIFIFRLRWQLGAIIAGLFALVSIKFDIINDILPRWNSIRQSATGRKNIWENSIHIWSDHPFFGVTPIGFREAYDAIAHDKVAHAHNIFLGFFSEYGTMGGLAFVFLFLTLFYKVVFVLFTFRNKKKYLDIFLLLMPVFLITGIFDHPLISPQTALLSIFVIAGWEHYVRKINFFSKESIESKHARAQ